MTDIKEQILKIIAKVGLHYKENLKQHISEIIIKNNTIGFSINIETLTQKKVEEIREVLTKEIEQHINCDRVTIVLTKNNSSNNSSYKSKPKQLIDGVKKLILISSAKGGVGKSTITTILAENLNKANFKVGILDADIYGPSIPTIFNIDKKPDIKNGLMIPHKIRGIELNSIGFLNPSQGAISWRGPMISKMIYQLISLTAWHNLDYLLIDMPPGTGDIHLSILENYNIDGAVIITTPQKISLVDVRRSIDLYKKFDIQILGLIENMSYFINENNKIIKIFNGSSMQELDREYEIPFKYQILLNPKIAEYCDHGKTLRDLVNIPLDFLY